MSSTNSREERARRRELARDDQMSQMMREVTRSPSKAVEESSDEFTAKPVPPQPSLQERSGWTAELPSRDADSRSDQEFPLEEKSDSVAEHHITGTTLVDDVPGDAPADAASLVAPKQGSAAVSDKERRRSAVKRNSSKTVETLQRSLLWMGATVAENLFQEENNSTGIRTRRMVHETRSQQHNNSRADATVTTENDPTPLDPPQSVMENEEVATTSRRRKRQREAPQENAVPSPIEPDSASFMTPTQVVLTTVVDETSQSNTSCPSPPNTDEAVVASSELGGMSLEKRRAAKRRQFHRGPTRRLLDAEDKCFADLQTVAESQQRAPFSTEAQVIASSSFCVANETESFCNALLRFKPELILEVARGGAVPTFLVQ